MPQHKSAIKQAKTNIRRQEQNRAAKSTIRRALRKYRELAPEARGALFSLNVTAFSLSRALGGIVGGWLWQWQNIALQAGVGAACALAAALLFGWGIRESGTQINAD